MKIGYARCSTDQQDVQVQHQQLLLLGVEEARIYIDHGRTGTTRQRPGLTQALAACREGDELVVTKLDRLARSVPDARAIASELEATGVGLNIGGSLYRPDDPMGRLLFNVLAMIAEFEADLIRARTREGLELARQKGRLIGGKPKLSPKRAEHLVRDHRSGDYTIAELSEAYGISRATVYRIIARSRAS